MEDILEKLLVDLKELQKSLEKKENNSEKVSKYIDDALINMGVNIELLDDIDNGKTLEEAFNNHLNKYDYAYSKCIESGKLQDTKNDKRKFTKKYISSIMGVLSILFTIDSVTESTIDLTFLKYKAKEIVELINKLMEV